MSKKETFYDIQDYWINTIKDNAPANVVIALAGSYL
jgi:hypothetical protein